MENFGLTEKIKEQIAIIRDSGSVNMLVVSAVQLISDVRGYLELSLFLQGHRRKYINYILTGEEAESDG